MLKPFLRTQRLELIAGTLETYNTHPDDGVALSRILGIRVPPSWPPEHYDEEALAFFRKGIEEKPEAGNGWLLSYLSLREESDRGLAIGTMGATGLPDENGRVMVGYSVLPEHQRRGYASEALAALVRWIFLHPAVTEIVADTYPDLPASIGTLLKTGFEPAGAGDGERVIRFVLSRS